MSGLDDIGVSIETGPGVRPLETANARALLSELEAALQALLNSGREHSVDLRSLPLLPGELDYLRETLGRGEVRAELDALGRSEIRETALRGVWWVTHWNTLDEVMAEFLEVSFCPDILRAQRDDVSESLEALNARLAGDA